MIANQNQSNKEKEEGFKVKKRTLDLLPDAENNIAKLQVCGCYIQYIPHR